jgi:membrane protease YdiL (CAAX protease family)
MSPLNALGFTIGPALIVAAVLTLTPLIAAAFFLPRVTAWVERFPLPLRLLFPILLCVPYALVTNAFGMLRWQWLVLYALLPVGIAWLLWQARQADRAQRGDWRDFLVLGALGLAVDLRWLEPAWPAHLAVFSKMLLLDAGIYGFLVIRQLEGVGFDLRLRLRDVFTGLREFAWYAPIAIALGLSFGFLHVHAVWPRPLSLVGGFVFTFAFIAIPEELFFRGWMQNLLERRFGRTPALMATAVLFGLSHFNKRAAHFNWRYVALAALAGIAYGRAWRRDRRVGVSAITHACVDTIWSQWLR